MNWIHNTTTNTKPTTNTNKKNTWTPPIAFRHYNQQEQLTYRILIYHAMNLLLPPTTTTNHHHLYKSNPHLYTSLHDTLLFFYHQAISSSSIHINPDPNFILPLSMSLDILPQSLSLFLSKSLKSFSIHHNKPMKLKRRTHSSSSSFSTSSCNPKTNDILHIIRSFLYTFTPPPDDLSTTTAAATTTTTTSPLSVSLPIVVATKPTNIVSPLAPTLIKQQQHMIPARETVNHHQPLLPIHTFNLNSPIHVGLCCKNLCEITPYIGSLQQANVLQLCCNQLSTLPPNIGSLSQLTILSLSKNLLTHLPNELGHLTNLMELDVSCNQLTFIPKSIGQLSKLHILRLNNNRLTTLPFHLGRLHMLVQLDVSDNPIISIPSAIIQLKHLRKLRTRNCPLLFTTKSQIPTTSTHFHLDPVLERHHGDGSNVLSLRELIARKLITSPSVWIDINQIPPSLVNYLFSFEYCSVCQTPCFQESRLIRYRKLIRSSHVPPDTHLVIPSHDVMCTNHFDNELGRINALFSIPTSVSTADPISRSIRLAHSCFNLCRKGSSSLMVGVINKKKSGSLDSCATAQIPTFGPIAALHALRILPPLPPVPTIQHLRPAVAALVGNKQMPDANKPMNHRVQYFRSSSPPTSPTTMTTPTCRKQKSWMHQLSKPLFWFSSKFRRQPSSPVVDPPLLPEVNSLLVSSSSGRDPPPSTTTNERPDLPSSDSYLHPISVLMNSPSLSSSLFVATGEDGTAGLDTNVTAA